VRRRTRRRGGSWLNRGERHVPPAAWRLLPRARAGNLRGAMAPVDSVRAAWREDRAAAFVAVVFFVLGALWLGSSAHYHGDERYYTDAALRMLASGDPWTPEYADGAARLNKPLLSYWVLMASFAALGVNLFVARLPFLLAGACTVFLTARLARVLFVGDAGRDGTDRGDESWRGRVPLVAAAIAAANIELTTLSRRSTPDIGLVLAVTIAWIGLARVLVARETGRGPAWWLWIGVGTAVAVKGALGLLVAAFAVVAALALRRRGVRVRELVSWPACLAAVLIGAVGLAPQWLATRAPGGANLFDDQVGDRVAASLGAVIQLAGRYGGSLVRHGLPWTIWIVVGMFAARPALIATWRRHARALVLVAAFVGLLWLVFSLGNTHRGRYLSPAYPPAAAALAVCVTAVSASRVGRGLVDGARVVLGAVTAILALAIVRLDLGAALACGLVSVCAFAPVGGARDAGLALARLGVVLCAVSVSAAEGVRAWLDPSPIEIAARAERVDATLGFTSPTRGHLHVVSGGRLDPAWLPDDARDEDVLRHAVILATGPARERLERLGYVLEPCGESARDVKPKDVVPLLTARDSDSWFRGRGEPVSLARRASKP